MIQEISPRLLFIFYFYFPSKLFVPLLYNSDPRSPTPSFPLSPTSRTLDNPPTQTQIWVKASKPRTITGRRTIRPTAARRAPKGTALPGHRSMAQRPNRSFLTHRLATEIRALDTADMAWDTERRRPIGIRLADTTPSTQTTSKNPL